MTRWTLTLLVACNGKDDGGGDDSDEPAPTEDEVLAEIEAANHCEAAGDCVDLGSQCPFGCWILVNAEEADAVQAAIDAWYDAGNQPCDYSCAPRGEIQCDGGRCEASATY